MSFIKTLVLPNLYHKKRSYLLQHKAFLGYFIFIIILIYISYQITTAMPSVLGYAENVKIPDLLGFTNKIREERGLSDLKLNIALSKAAEAKAEDMLEKDYWAHTSPDGKEPWDFIISSGYDYLYAGENLAVDFNNSESVVDAWYDSASHRKNLLSDKYTEIGFAVVNGEFEGRKTTIVVQMFGYPRTSSPVASSASTSVAEIVPEVVIEENILLVEVEQETAELAVNVESVPPAKSENAENINVTNSVGAVLNSADVFNVSRFIAIILGLFITAMFAVDGYYVKRMGVFRISGHTILHILMLIAAVAGIWYTQIGLVL